MKIANPVVIIVDIASHIAFVKIKLLCLSASMYNLTIKIYEIIPISKFLKYLIF
uniref:Uncharacterized protein n=1 Tax=viral metagenome TaxID=1070528 RepID=A0A6C0B0K6_9ZZZZ